MEAAIKIIEAVMPLIVEIVKQHHADKTPEDQKRVVESLVNSALTKVGG